MIEAIKSVDRELFLFLNGLNDPALDQAMYYMTEDVFWIPFFLLMLWMVYKAQGWKLMLWTLLGVALVVTLGDRISVELFKNVFQRYRPSHNLELADKVHLVNGYRGGKFGFVSSHATNSLGIATFVYLLVRPAFAKWAWIIIAWAVLFSYTRIYLGVHYPADVVCGGLLGVGIGYFVYLVFRKFVLNRFK
jgi:undecaprenyl-diphosphatase